MTEGDKASQLHQAIAGGNARGRTEIRLRLRSPAPAIIEPRPSRPTLTRFRRRRRPTPAVPGGVSASCLATSLETAYRKNPASFSEFLPVSRSIPKVGRNEKPVFFVLSGKHEAAEPVTRWARGGLWRRSSL